MAESLEGKLVIATSSRSLFDLEASNRIFETQGPDAYKKHQLKYENTPPKPGCAYSLIKRLLDLRHPQTDEQLVEIVLLSDNDPDISVRLFNAIKEYKLPITRGVFTKGRGPYKYLEAFNASLFLSANESDVRMALQHGFAAATVATHATHYDDDGRELRIAFDGDAVLFSDEAERINQEDGLAAFQKNEEENADVPLNPGPFMPFLKELSRIQSIYRDTENNPIRTALITARGRQANKRAITTLRHYKVMIDEAFFLSGLDKTKFIAGFKPHIYLDDQRKYCDAMQNIVPTGHVPYGVINEPPIGGS